MTSALLLTLASLGALPASTTPTAPLAVLVSTSRGDVRVPVRSDPLWGPMLPAPTLLAALRGRAAIDGAWAEVEVGHLPFRFLLGASLYSSGQGGILPLAGAAALRRDTLFLPLEFVSSILPTILGQRFRYEPKSGRLVELGGREIASRLTSTRDPERMANGLRRGHVVTVDAGHGGVDPGNPGLFFPWGLKEKDVTLRVSLLLREELLRRGIAVTMTRTTDTLIDLRQRGAYCQNSCDLFVSIHVNSLPRRTGFTKVRGFETYFLAEAKTEDAARVARMENEAVRFERRGEDGNGLEGLDFILKDLQTNEHLRESARIAELVQSHLQEVHSGEDLGVKQAGFMVLTTARRPAVLVELGFSTNPQDARLLTDATSQRNLATSIADAILAYLLEYERRAGTASDAEGH